MKKLAVLAILFVTLNLHAEQINSVVAKVNDEIITAKDLADYCNMVKYQYQHGASMSSVDPSLPDFKKKALDKMIEEKLILFAARAEQKRREEVAKKNEKEASKIRLEAPDAMIEKQIKGAMAEFSDRAAFEKSLADNGLNNELLRERYRNQWLMQVIVEIDVSAYVNVAPQEAAEFYRKNKETFKSSTTYELYMGRFIDMKDWNGFKDLLLAKGIDAAQKNYAHIVKKMTTSAQKLRAEFATPLETLKEGGHFTTMIDEDKYFLYLIKRTPPQQLTFKQVEAQITNFIWTKKFRRQFSAWVSSLRRKAIIRTYL